jgi:hypothetical protein
MKLVDQDNRRRLSGEVPVTDSFQGAEQWDNKMATQKQRRQPIYDTKK